MKPNPPTTERRILPITAYTTRIIMSKATVRDGQIVNTMTIGSGAANANVNVNVTKKNQHGNTIN